MKIIGGKLKDGYINSKGVCLGYGNTMLQYDNEYKLIGIMNC